MNIKKIAKVGGYVLPILIGVLEAVSFGLDYVNSEDEEVAIKELVSNSMEEQLKEIGALQASSLNNLIEEKLKERGL